MARVLPAGHRPLAAFRPQAARRPGPRL